MDLHLITVMHSHFMSMHYSGEDNYFDILKTTQIQDTWNQH